MPSSGSAKAQLLKSEGSSGSTLDLQSRRWKQHHSPPARARVEWPKIELQAEISVSRIVTAPVVQTNTFGALSCNLTPPADCKASPDPSSPNRREHREGAPLLPVTRPCSQGVRAGALAGEDAKVGAHLGSVMDLVFADAVIEDLVVGIAQLVQQGEFGIVVLLWLEA